ncbi:MAG TPA: aldehyde dehydrogenase family protein [Solirubrobacteraceae bacterium]|jgi:NADP-dependent aldehyde dehydrogenase|nr:aldehyde dehydrogenase family protein [Solirubrobacteraceae bacterium]
MSIVEAVDPRSGRVAGSYPAARVEDVDAALAAAVEAAASPAMRDDARRAAALRAAAGGLRARGGDVVAVAGGETGLPEARLRGELERTAVQLELLADHVAAGEHHDAIVDRADPDWRPLPRPDLRRRRVPIGPVAVFGASNFPLAFSTGGGDTGAALAAGCPAIVKGHPSHPGTGTLVAEVLAAAVEEAGLPAGAFAHLLAAELDVAEALVDHPATAAVAFTGSFRAGTALIARANARPTPIPVFAEMGSLNPVVVTHAALAARGDAIAEALAGAVGTFGGQLCTKPGLVFAPAGSTLAADLAAALGARREVLLNANVHRGYGAGVEALAAAEGVERLTPAAASGGDGGANGDGAAGGDAVRDAGFAVAPAVFRTRASALAATPALGEECFGPAVVVLEYEAGDDLHAALGALGGQLAAALYAEPAEHPALAPLVERLTELAGRVIFDGVPTGVSVTLAMHHGGPWPATSAPAHTSVGATAVDRFLRPVVYQDAPDALLPPALQDANPLNLLRRVDGERTREPVVR